MRRIFRTGRKAGAGQDRKGWKDGFRVRISKNEPGEIILLQIQHFQECLFTPGRRRNAHNIMKYSGE